VRSPPRVVVTTTPKPIKIIRELIADPTTVIIKVKEFSRRHRQHLFAGRRIPCGARGCLAIGRPRHGTLHRVTLLLWHRLTHCWTLCEGGDREGGGRGDQFLRRLREQEKGDAEENTDGRDGDEPEADNGGVEATCRNLC
jgi:hypothetical protein